MASTAGLLRCWVQYGQSAAIVRARGEVDLSSAEALRRCIDRAFGRAHPVVVDLTQVSYLDGTGFRVLEAMTSRAVSEGRAFWVVPGGHVRRMLTVLGLQTIPVADSLEEAIDRCIPD